MTLDESKQDNDQVVENNGIKIVYNKDLAGYLGRAAVDYSDLFLAKGFILKGVGLSSC